MAQPNSDRARRRLDVLTNADPRPEDPRDREREFPTREELHQRIATEAGRCPMCDRELTADDVRTHITEEIDEEHPVGRCGTSGCRNTYEPGFGWAFDSDGPVDPRERDRE